MAPGPQVIRDIKIIREVAQAGSAPGLGPGGRRFESCLPDKTGQGGFFATLFFYVILKCCSGLRLAEIGN